MNKIIKEQIENYVTEKFETLNQMNKQSTDYNEVEAHTVKMINTLVETLQKEDINEENILVNTKKLAMEEVKIGYDYELGIKKVQTEISKNEDSKYLEEKKIEYNYKLEIKKIDNDIAKIENDTTKINVDQEINEKKMDCEIIKNKQDLMKINNEYEINIQKLNIESIKNTNDDVMENKKLNHTITDDDNNFKLKDKEFKINLQNNKDLNKERLIKVLIDGAAVVIPVVFYNVWMNKGFKFEEEGTFTSNTFKNLIGKFKLTK